MSKNRGIVLFVVAVVIFSSLALLFTSGEALYSGQSAATYSTPVIAWTGNLVINPDGSLSTPLAPVVKIGNTYTLTGNISGSVQISRAGAIFDGNGYTVVNYQATSPLQLSGADHITLENTRIISEWASGINIYQSSNDVVTNNSVTGMASGIYVYAPYDSVIGNDINITITNSQYNGLPVGIVTYGSYTNITGNSIYMPTGSNGIIVDSQHSIIKNNSVLTNGYNSVGLTAMNGYNTISDNSFIVTGEYGIGVSLSTGSQFNLVNENSVNVTGTYARGVYAADGFNDISMNNISVTGSWSSGISISASGTGSSEITGNEVFVSGPYAVGIYSNIFNSTILSNNVYVEGDSPLGILSFSVGSISWNSVTVSGPSGRGIYSEMNGRIISGNVINATGNSTYGLYITGAFDLGVSANVITTSGGHSTAAYFSGTYSKFSFNQFTAGFNNGIAIQIKSSSADNTFLNNSFSYSSTGLKASITSGNLFEGNAFVNDTYAFILAGHNANTYYHNSFVNYSTYSISSDTQSVWDNGYPSGGNFWSSYTGVDYFSGPGQNITGSDGIGDTQFNVSSNNIDHYPLMRSWSSPKTVFVESGLSTGTEWSVTFNGVTAYSTNDTISFDIPNAAYSSYSYTVSEVPGYTITVNPGGTVTYTGAGTTVYVTYQVSVTPPPPKEYTVTFTQTGLPTGTSWSITFNGTVKTTIDSFASFDAVNGTYDYVAGAVPGYSISGAGTVTVNGQDENIVLQYSAVTYSVIFTESGLPSGTTWYVNITGGASYYSTTSTITADLANGSYSYTVATVDKSLSSPGGAFTVDGASLNIAVTFSPVEYKVTFTESGLPSGTAWYANITGGASHSSSTEVIDAYLANSTYSYSSSSVDRNFTSSGGSFTVSGSDVNVSVVFSPVTYQVKFNESGLPSGTEWYVNVTGETSSGPITGVSYTAGFSNGSYSFSVATPDKRYTSTSGSFSVNGLPKTVNVTFTLLAHQVTFSETGLISGVNWYVNVSGQQSSGPISSDSHSISLPNGTYSYSIGTPNKVFSASGGTFTVNGGGKSVAVQFSTVLYTVTFSDKGLPSGTKWYVNLSNGDSYSSTTSELTMELTNGTYSYSVGNVTGYSVSPGSGNVTVSGSAPNPLTVNFSKTSSPSGIPFWVYVIIGIIIGAGGTAVGLVVYYRRK